MAESGQSACFSDPNFAVICSFLQRFGEHLGLPSISTTQLAEDIEDTKGVSELLEQMHIFLMRRLVKSLKRDEWQKQLAKLCNQFSEVDAWECNKKGYRKLKVSTKLRILKYLLESQFDKNNKFREKVGEIDPDVLRLLPIGRDRNGLAYWYFTDHEYNVQVYREEQDDMDADTWQVICRCRDDVAYLVTTLQTPPTTTDTGENSRAPTPHDQESQMADVKTCPENEEKENQKINNNLGEVKKEEGQENTADINKKSDNETESPAKTEITENHIENDGDEKLKEDIKKEPTLDDKCKNEPPVDDKCKKEPSIDCKVELEKMDIKGDQSEETKEEKCIEDENESTAECTEASEVDKPSVDEEVDEKEDQDSESESDEEPIPKIAKGRPKKNTKKPAKKQKQKPKQTVDENFSPRRSLRARKPVITEVKEVTDNESEDSEPKKEMKKEGVKAGITKAGKRGKKAVSSSDESFKCNDDNDDKDSDDSDDNQKSKRKKARTAKRLEDSDPGIPDDTPCNKCMKYNHPDKMLLCDKCDKAYHMSCLRPPLMVIPEGDWFCQPCDHVILIGKLQEALKELDGQSKKRERLLKRKERLAFVGISLDNILPMEEKQSESGQDSYDSSDEERARKKKKKQKGEQFVKRSCRQRKQISYKFEEFDELINDAIEDDDKGGYEEGGTGGKGGKDMANIVRSEARRVSGKDISNIIGLENEADDRPASRKKARRLTALDDEPEASDESEEYQASESASEQAADSSYSEESDVSDDWGDATWGRSGRGRGRGRQGSRQKKRKSYRERFDYGMDDFVVDEYDSEEDLGKRRSSRVQARQKKMNKNIISSDEELASTPEESEDSDFSDSDDSRVRNKWNKKSKTKKRTGKRKGVSESDSDDSAVVIKSHSRKKPKRRNFSSSDDDDDDNVEENGSDVSGVDQTTVRKSQRSCKRTNYENLLKSDEEEDESDGEKKEENEEENKSEKDNKMSDSDEKEENDEKDDIDENEDSEVGATINGTDYGAVSQMSDNKPNESFMIDNLLRDTKPGKSAMLDNDDDLDLEGVTDLISFVTQDDDALT